MIQTLHTRETWTGNVTLYMSEHERERERERESVCVCDGESEWMGKQVMCVQVKALALFWFTACICRAFHMTLYHQTHIGTRCIIIYGKIQLQSVRISMLHFMGLSGAKVTKLVDVGSSRESRTAGQHVPTADTIPSPSRLQFASLRLLTFSLSLSLWQSLQSMC